MLYVLILFNLSVTYWHNLWFQNKNNFSSFKLQKLSSQWWTVKLISKSSCIFSFEELGCIASLKNGLKSAGRFLRYTFVSLSACFKHVRRITTQKIFAIAYASIIGHTQFVKQFILIPYVDCGVNALSFSQGVLIFKTVVILKSGHKKWMKVYYV